VFKCDLLIVTAKDNLTENWILLKLKGKSFVIIFMQGVSIVWPTAGPVKIIATITYLQRNLTWRQALLYKLGGLKFLSKIGAPIFNLRECGGRPLGFKELRNF